MSIRTSDPESRRRKGSFVWQAFCVGEQPCYRSGLVGWSPSPSGPYPWLGFNFTPTTSCLVITTETLLISLFSGSRWKQIYSRSHSRQTVNSDRGEDLDNLNKSLIQNKHTILLLLPQQYI